MLPTEDCWWTLPPERQEEGGTRVLRDEPLGLLLLLLGLLGPLRRGREAVLKVLSPMEADGMLRPHLSLPA